MKIRDFELEQWLNPLVDKCKYNMGASCVKAFTLDEMLDLAGVDQMTFLEEIRTMSLHYGHFFGLDRLKEALAAMYKGIEAEMILTVHGGTGANNMVLTEMVSPGDNVVAIVPNYQQHYSIPEALGAEVRYLWLKEENGYLPDLDELKALVDSKTKLITLSNPNNPTGAYMPKELQQGICDIAAQTGTYILSDEIYRGLKEGYMTSFADLYERSIVTSSTSKVFSMAGTRVGWIVAKEKAAFDRLENRRSYDTICGGVFDELVSAIALEHYEKVLARARGIAEEGRSIFNAWIKTQPRLSADYENYGTTSFVRYDYDYDSRTLCNKLFHEASVLLCHGDCFDFPKAFRLGYTFGEPALLTEALGVLGDYLAKL